MSGLRKVAERARARFRIVRRGLLAHAVDRLLAGEGPLRVAVLADPSATLPRPLRTLAADSRVLMSRVDVASDETEVWGRLAGAGPLHLLVDLAATSGAARFSSYFLLVAHGGHYVAVGSRAGADIEGAVAADGNGAVAKAVAELSPTSDGVLVRRRGRSLAKMREEEMRVAFAADPSRGRVLVEMAGATLHSRCVPRVYGVGPGARAKASYVAPPMYLREYVEPVCGEASVVVQRGLVAPDSYRHPQRRLHHRALRDVSDRFVRSPFGAAAVSDLPGTWFHLDNEWRTGFGHALTDQLSRLWAWEEARRTAPDVRALVTRNRDRGVAEWERVLYRAAGVPPEDLVLVDAPVRVERLLSATPMYALNQYLHPGLLEVWDRVGSTLRAAASSSQEWPRRLFVTRSSQRRACLNRDEVERLFVDHGFTVVHPEQLSLPDQAQMLHDAEVVAGFAGSQMLTVLFSDRPKHLVLLRARRYRAANEYMVCAARGHRLDEFVSTEDPDFLAAHPRAAFRAPFRVQWDREGAALRRLLAELPERPRGDFDGG